MSTHLVHMSTHLNGWLLAGALAVATVAAAQIPPSQPPQSPRPTTTARPIARGSEGIVTVEGCLVREADVPGRIPKTPEGAGVAGDYILTRAKVIKGTAPASLTGMYDVDDIDAGELASYVGQRVQIDGWFDELDRAANPAGRGGAQKDLVEIRGSAIRSIAKDCGA
jgi:hypothetical protein